MGPIGVTAVGAQVFISDHTHKVCHIDMNTGISRSYDGPGSGRSVAIAVSPDGNTLYYADREGVSEIYKISVGATAP
jgi:DNA-binding beta-propeller fold protein YncE